MRFFAIPDPELHAVTLCFSATRKPPDAEAACDVPFKSDWRDPIFPANAPSLDRSILSITFRAKAGDHFASAFWPLRDYAAAQPNLIFFDCERRLILH
jgi:hypothetical protein